MKQTSSKLAPESLQDWLRLYTAGLSGVIGGSVYRLGIHPNWITWSGLFVTVLAGLFIVQGRFVIAGWLILLSGFLDVLDGAVARAGDKLNAFGGVLDSVLDRYADGFIFGSLGYYFAQQDQSNLMLLSLATLMGSYVISYVRARAATPDVAVSVTMGLFTRLERLVLVILAFWFHIWLLVPVLWLLAIGTNFTAMQRLWYVRNKIGV